jgi:hypothetical protein
LIVGTELIVQIKVLNTPEIITIYVNKQDSLDQ